MLEPVDAATTRLLVRMRVSYQPAAKWAPYMWLAVEPAHFIMGRRQLLGIRRRVEAKLGDGLEAGRGRGDARREIAPPIGGRADSGSGRRPGRPAQRRS